MTRLATDAIAMRRADRGDDAVLAAAHRTCFAPPWDAEAIRTLLSTPGTAAWLAEAPGRPALGLAMARIAGDDAEILTIGVAAAQRRRGVGRSLLDAMIVWALAADAERLLLEVAADNEAACALYESAGFRRCGQRPGYYSGMPRRDALVLELPLA